MTWIEALGVHVMTYVAYGPLGPRSAVATSTDLRTWTRHGPVHFAYDDELDCDLNLFHNKDTVVLRRAGRGPGRHAEPGRAAPADVGSGRDPARPGPAPAGRDCPTPGTASGSPSSRWPRRRLISVALTIWPQHRFLAGPEFAYEELKIGGGPAPLRVPEGWLVFHHGVTGELVRAFAQQQHVNYAAGAMILDADRPWEVVCRTSTPLLEPETADERSGIVPNVVFPTAIEDGRRRALPLLRHGRLQDRGGPDRRAVVINRSSSLTEDIR